MRGHWVALLDCQGEKYVLTDDMGGPFLGSFEAATQKRDKYVRRDRRQFLVVLPLRGKANLGEKECLVGFSELKTCWIEPVPLSIRFAFLVFNFFRWLGRIAGKVYI